MSIQESVSYLTAYKNAELIEYKTKSFYHSALAAETEIM